MTKRTLEDLLVPYRLSIDEIDTQILELINKRAGLAQQIGLLKGTTVAYRPEREALILDKLRLKNPGPLSDSSVTRLFREIMSECLALERVLQVACLGPEGSFTQQATIQQFGQAAKVISCSSVAESMTLTEKRETDYTMVPVENSTEGAVNRTLDLLVSTPLLIQNELTLQIHHQLLSCCNKISQIKKILAHPQALAQCRGWIERNLNPHVLVIPTNSNAEGAKRAKEDPSAAALASSIAAKIYQLNILAIDVEDEVANTTRFLVLGHQKVPATGKDKTSLIVSAPNQPGTIHRLLEPFSRYQISLTKLESRPSKSGLWDYIFFIDFLGHIQDETVSNAMKVLKERALFVKWLGSYPRAPL
ncbi:MAG: prephenate dehydratase [Neisseriaceae bacterium]